MVSAERTSVDRAISAFARLELISYTGLLGVSFKNLVTYFSDVKLLASPQMDFLSHSSLEGSYDTDEPILSVIFLHTPDWTSYPSLHNVQILFLSAFEQLGGRLGYLPFR